MASHPEVSAMPVLAQNRTNKTSAIRSFIHKRTLSKGAALSSKPDFSLAESPTEQRPVSFLPADHPHSRPLGELQMSQQNQLPSSPKKSREGERPAHKKTLSTISLKGLGRDADKNTTAVGEKELGKPKKTKSSTNLSNLLSRPKSSKSLKKQAAADEEEARLAKDKENTAPSQQPQSPSRPPIYAQFSSEYFNKQPLGGKFLEDEIDLYTPQQYSPTKQRNFYEGPNTQPSLAAGDNRPQSTYLPSEYSLKDISRQNSSARKSSEESRPLDIASADWNSPSKRHTYMDHTAARRRIDSRSVFQTGGSNNSKASSKESVDMKEIDAALEDLLDRRNIPEDQRYKMRSVALAVKLDLIKHDKEEALNTPANRPSTNSSVESTASESAQPKTPEAKKRPRSRTFTLSRASKDTTSPTKKAKPEETVGKHHIRTKSSDSGILPSKSFTGTGANVASNIIAKARGQTPDDFVSYLRKVQAPQAVEVGKMQKLRQLLRNEKIGWTDEFINLSGMKEIIGLLHRIMEVEWREEHEDALLHETLLCLKALCTTTMGQGYLNTIQSTLFPALIYMIFDPEKKGPSEFTTRNIITWLLFTYLKSAPLGEREGRARTILGYLRNPMPEENDRPVPFVLDMHRERPYTVWCKEVVNVTKEVFWIFLHHLNVVSLPTATSLSPAATTEYSYMLTHFPTDPPPVPAAPYVGSVEWDATNYLTSHLDILNGIIACLPTLAERNMLRDSLRISGIEKCLGGMLRTCKEKFYGGVHAGLRTWVAAAVDDGWEVSDVRCGPRSDGKSPSRKSPQKKKVEEAPKIEMPLFDFANPVPNGAEFKGQQHDAWL